MSLTRQQAIRLMERFQEHEAFCRESLCIRNKAGITVDLNLSPAQRKLSALVAKQRRAGRPVRIIALKARQVHMSVGAVSEFFRGWAFQPGQKGLIVGHEHKSATNLFGYLLQFYDGYRPFNREADGSGGLLVPKVVRLNRPTPHSGGLMELDTQCMVTSQSADNVSGGRSESIRHLLLSELAFYRAGEELFVGLLQSVPDDAGTTIIAESTPNGLGNLFHRMWMEATDPAHGSAFLPLFFGSHEHPEYRMPVEDAYNFQRSMTDEEHDLLKRFQIEQPLQYLAWRRWAIKNKCQGSIEIFHQEYSMTPEEAFLASGRPRLDMVSLSRMPVRTDSAVGELEVRNIGTREVITFMERESRHGALQLWKRPEKYARYIVGADTSEGIDVAEGVGSADPDYSVGQVLNQETGEQVAVLRGRLTPAAFGQYLVTLGRWYNNAYLVIERNGIGQATILAVTAAGYPQQMLFREPDSDKLGWETTGSRSVASSKKHRMVSQLDVAIQEGEIIVHDPVTLAECRTFVVHPDGKVAAQKKCHDDTVMALALAVVGLPFARLVRDVAADGVVKAQRYGQRGDDWDERPRGRAWR